MSDLKPCPFCGAQGISTPCFKGDHPAHTSCSGGNGDCSATGPWWTPESWNRRHHDATETAALRQVRDNIMKFRGILRAGNERAVEWDVAFTNWLAALDAILKERE